MFRIVADLGNSRLKWGRLGAGGRLEETVSLPVDDPSTWDQAWNQWDPSRDGASTWAIASVNPPVAERLAAFLAGRPAGRTHASWYRSAVDVPVRHSLERLGSAGADRALAVSAAVSDHPHGRPGMVVLCGTAVTVERVTADGVWQGGAIAAGLNLTARALHMLTAQLPLIEPREAPPAWGNATLPALEAGIFWGVVGAVRELLTRQAIGLNEAPWVVWTGGDADPLARAVDWPDARVVPDLVLRGLAGQFAGAAEG